MKEIGQLNFVKNKNFCSAKGTARRIERQITDWEKLLQNVYLIKDFIQNTQRTFKSQE